MIVLSTIFSLKHSKANDLPSTNLLFTPSWSSMEKNKILFVAIYKGELNPQQGWGGGGENAETYPKCR